MRAECIKLTCTRILTHRGLPCDNVPAYWRKTDITIIRNEDGQCTVNSVAVKERFEEVVKEMGWV